MKFDKLRGLKNNVFSTKLIRVEDDNQDCKVKEALLEDDFGYVEVQIGGRFEGVVTPDGVDTSSETLEGKKSSEILAFALPSSKVQLTIGKEISFTCDANKEVSRIFNEIQVPALKIAEAKCRIFEEVMEKRIGEAIEAWKKQGTEFEQEILEPLHFSLN
jgi:hypothetical protein